MLASRRRRILREQLEATSVPVISKEAIIAKLRLELANLDGLPEGDQAWKRRREIVTALAKHGAA